MPNGTSAREAAEKSGPAPTQEVFPPGTPAMQLPITPMVPASAAGIPPGQTAVPMPTPAQLNYRDVLALGNELVKTGFLPEEIKTGAQAAAIILAGHEIGLPAMKSLRSIRLVKGQVVLSADLQLGIFKSRGGRARFRELSDARAVLDMVHPNGDTHTETFSMDDALRAGLLRRTRNNEPSNYEKFPRPMLRSRCITAGLKSLGFEELAGAYDPEEAKHFDGSNAFAFVDEETADATRTGSSNGSGTAEPPPSRYTQRVGGHWLDEKHTEGEKAGEYFHSPTALEAQYDWALDMAVKHEEDKERRDKFSSLAEGIKKELSRREAERDEETAPGAMEAEAAGVIADATGTLDVAADITELFNTEKKKKLRGLTDDMRDAAEDQN